MVTNKEISKLLYDVADAYEVRGVDWKPRAYRRAARSVGNLDKDIVKLYKEEGKKTLVDLPGIGNSIADHIVEYIKKGNVKEFEEIFDEVSKEQASLMKIEGLGPKKIKKLEREI